MPETASRRTGELAAAILGFVVASFIVIRRWPHLLPVVLVLAMIGLLLVPRSCPSILVDGLEIVVSPILQGCKLGVRHGNQLTVSVEMLQKLKAAEEKNRPAMISALEIIDTRPPKV